uniref:Uncharacterized protein n=1 Tax=Arundo donax TaxID=35708 RepID=A0A0A9GWH2_ARUDO
MRNTTQAEQKLKLPGPGPGEEPSPCHCLFGWALIRGLGMD